MLLRKPAIKALRIYAGVGPKGNIVTRIVIVYEDAPIDQAVSVAAMAIFSNQGSS
jgi:hypothetical protein